MDINNLIIDHILRANAVDKDGKFLFGLNQIQNPSLNCTSESTDVVDALGSKITTLYRAKSAEFSGENALFDLGLMAAQVGAEKKVATSSAKVVAPAFETIDITSAATYTLKHTPNGDITEIYALNGDSSLGKKYVAGTEASATEFVVAGATLTPPTGLTAGKDQLFVMYEYEAESAVEVVNSAKNFPVACKFIAEALCYEPCDPATKILCYIIMPNVKLSPDFDWSIQSDGSHPFTFMVNQDYCDREKKLFSIVVVEE